MVCTRPTSCIFLSHASRCPSRHFDTQCLSSMERGERIGHGTTAFSGTTFSIQVGHHTLPSRARRLMGVLLLGSLPSNEGRRGNHRFNTTPDGHPALRLTNTVWWDSPKQCLSRSLGRIGWLAACLLRHSKFFFVSQGTRRGRNISGHGRHLIPSLGKTSTHASTQTAHTHVYE